MRENPVITDWVHVSGGSTEGTLGRLAGAAAGGAQGMLAAGDSVNFCLPCRAAFPLSTRCATIRSVTHRDLSLESDRFLIVRIDSDRAQRIFTRFAAVAAFEKNLAQQDVGVNEFRIPEDRRLQRCDRCFLIAATQIYATAEQIR